MRESSGVLPLVVLQYGNAFHECVMSNELGRKMKKDKEGFWEGFGAGYGGEGSVCEPARI